jgi:hypothetical protein
VEIELTTPDQKNLDILPMRSACQRPNRVRLESTPAPGQEMAILSDGAVLVVHHLGWNQYMQREAPARLASADMGMGGGTMALGMAVSADPLAELMQWVDAVEKVGDGKLGDVQTTVFELTPGEGIARGRVCSRMAEGRRRAGAPLD